ncbi:ArsR/SmtB family transcription factor [Rufibacter glacialis]|uniref:ArsR/SmtB family transcription factor n=1 Tax=Rufibacter glacialis TaxID=1259555 RepID=A0A5M8Q5V5_9BACT|nr:metalloregulator ArsR/SmtB family transcription factor [Rufibacter glacialis]KAA6430284.1 winged helix-turn-helix transcriptional regulator [Rufibacter glacialis]GGK87962.1 transcriptional regulator [Rufibacter glacialis]
MGVTKTQNFTAEQNQMAAYAKALAHPARVAILQYLLKKQTCICGDLVGELPLAQATVSQHLKELKAVGLIRGTVEGTSVCYCIDAQKWEEVREIFLGLLASPIQCQDNCC